MIRATGRWHTACRKLGMTTLLSGALVGGLVSAGSAWAADEALNDIVQTGVERQQKNQAFQQRINQLDDAIREKVENYREVNKQIEGLEVYLAQLQRQVSSQEAEMADLNSSIDRVTEIERQITPLMLKMVEGLKKFVALDMPFLEKERQERVARLQKMMDRSDVSAAEKFRNVLEAYQTEIDYGRNIEAYRGTLKQDGGEREVDFLRIGRIALLYQTLDNSETGQWNPNTEQWESLPPTYRTQVEDGLRIAREQAAPDLIKLPLTTPEEAK
ncbi:DUF3450 domain-containing protein [Marinobacteraceae bacterium S3BR75-40.1]